MTWTFRSLGKKFHQSIWCGPLSFLDHFYQVAWSWCQLIFLSMVLPRRILPPYHITCHSLTCCPVSNSVSLVSPRKIPNWDPLYWIDIPLLWHPIESLLSINHTTSNEVFLVWCSIGSIGKWNLKHDMILLWSIYFFWIGTVHHIDSWLLILIWHVTRCVVWSFEFNQWFGPWAAWIWFYDMLRSVTWFGMVYNL